MITNLCDGIYTVTVSDNGGCVVIDTFTVLEPAPLQTNGGNSDETIVGNDGSAWVTPTGGAPPYTYLWDNGSTDSLIVNLSAGEYFVTVTDANGCEASESFVVNPFICIPGLFWQLEDVSCFGGCDGSITAIIFGQGGPYSFEWNTSDTTGGLSIVCAGNYEVTITDLGQGCSEVSSLEISQPDSLYAEVDEIINLTDSTASAIYVSAIGGSPPYGFSWSGPNGYSSATEDPAGLSSGFYSVVITDFNGCQTNIDSIEVLDMTTGISPIPGWNLEIYPNPANDKVYIKGVDVNDYQIQLVSTDGHVWATWKNEVTLDVHDVAPGYYMLKFSTGENSLVKPLMIMR